MACELFGYDETEILGKLLKDLVKLKPKDPATITESHLEPTGEVVETAGKVVSFHYVVMPMQYSRTESF